MTQKSMSRRESRENAFLAAFASTFHTDLLQDTLQAGGENGDLTLDDFSKRLLNDWSAHAEEIDELITSHLKGWTLSRLPRVSLTAMRICLAEMLYGEEKKPAVAINEAVELVKKYGADNDHQFVNGLLGSVAREKGLAQESEGETC